MPANGKIALINFNELNKQELEVVDKILEVYTKKILEISDFKQLKLRLRKHKRGKTFLNEVNSEIIFSPRKGDKVGQDVFITSSVEEYKLFDAIAKVFKKTISQARKRIWESEEISRLRGKIKKA